MTKLAEDKHKVAYEDLCALIAKHKDSVSALELLALAANMVGKMIAFQDQSQISPDYAMRVVARNVEVGNREALAVITATKGNT